MASPKRNINSMAQFILFFITVLLALSCSTSAHRMKKPETRNPCKTLVLFFHDVIYNGKNAGNATSALVAGPEGTNLTILADNFHFGNIAVFDDPITVDNDFHSQPVGRAQGIYLYDSKNTFMAWLGFTFVLNSTVHGHGTINFIGANPLLNRTRDISVVGGTGDFFMHRGVATLISDAFEGSVYFRLKVDINFYECW